MVRPLGSSSKWRISSKCHYTQSITFWPKRLRRRTDSGVTPCGTQRLVLLWLTKCIHFSSDFTIRFQNRSSNGFSKSWRQIITRRFAWASVNSWGSCLGFFCTKSIWCRWLSTVWWDETPTANAKSRQLADDSFSKAARKLSSSTVDGCSVIGLSARSKSLSLKR